MGKRMRCMIGFVVCIGMVMTGMKVLEKKMVERVTWTEAAFMESNEKLENGERGFYHLAGYLITDNKNQTDEYCEQIANLSMDTRMMLLELNLQNYKDGKISESGMEQIHAVFRAYEIRGVDLILRFVYDWDGKAFLTEPVNVNTVLMHMEQIREVLNEYRDIIYIVQGVFVGNWGEMHGSKHLEEQTYRKLLNKLHEIVPKASFLAVRTPGYWRMAAGRMVPLQKEEAWKPERMISRISLYNDGMMGNELDYGTYGDVERKDAKDFSERWIRKDEIAFQNELNRYVPNGGEVIKNTVWNDLKPAISTLKTMHVSYLNTDYDPEVLQKWRRERYYGGEAVYAGMSGYDYMERHLGYRYVIRDAKVKAAGLLKKRLRVHLEIENVGFSSRYTSCKSVLELYEHKSGKKTGAYTLDTDVRTWEPSRSVKIREELVPPKKGEYDLYLRLTDEKKGKIIWLANETIGGREGKYFLGKLKIS